MFYPACPYWLAITSVQAHDNVRSETWLVYGQLMAHLHKNKSREMTLHQYGSQEFGQSCPVKRDSLTSRLQCEGFHPFNQYSWNPDGWV